MAARVGRASRQARLFDEPLGGEPVVAAEPGEETAIEDPAFPFEHISSIAELESWRKEIHRPVYHLHKWWAQRLGSVFRAILLGAYSRKGTDVYDLFYRPARLEGFTVFDPFMGSGTTVGEALKLGARAIGRDINPVAYFAVRNAMGMPPREAILNAFRAIERDLADELQSYYRAADGSAVLYYFWVKHVACPSCDRQVDLFTSYVFAQHAYPQQNPDAQALCPHCGGLNTVRYDSTDESCRNCGKHYDPARGPADRRDAMCPGCATKFPIAARVRDLGAPPNHRLYAKLVVTAAGKKEYRGIDTFDEALYQRAAAELNGLDAAFPVAAIAPGYNTDQVLNYCYRFWHEMFNARQLLCLGMLARRIRALPDEGLRDLFACLFSGLLEFNNMFASFKGEGTGAVRHMFSHHILKPERMPLEANIWGVESGSSGSFLTLFARRILRALDYCERPFELRVSRAKGRPSSSKAHDLSMPIGSRSERSYRAFKLGASALYLSCGSSSRTDIEAESVDAVVTDPPFFDNVHYSQLADFFHVWQRYLLSPDSATTTTRNDDEVQHSDAGAFQERLSSVWKECHRVLKPRGLLVFSYHHSRAEGWGAVLQSLVDAGFAVVQAHPVKAEMSVAMPKHQAREPIDVDMLLVCRKRQQVTLGQVSRTLLDEASAEAADQVRRFGSLGRGVSRNDVRVILTSQVVARLSRCLDGSVQTLDDWGAAIEADISRIHEEAATVSGAALG